MAKTKKEFLIAWLKDAYSLEKIIEQNLANHIEDTDEYSELQTLYKQHLKQTKSQAERIRALIESLGESISGLKVTLGFLSGLTKELPMSLADDVVVKDILNDYAAEQFEIVCYTSIIAAAEELGEVDILETCREIMAEEEAMASALSDYTSKITLEFLKLYNN